jgi:signal peptidase I
MLLAAVALGGALGASGCGGGETTKTTTYTVPSSSMEATLHCAEPRPGCLSNYADRIVVRPLEEGEPERGDVVAFDPPPLAEARCGPGVRFLQRVIGMPGETVDERGGFIFIDDGPRLSEPYVDPSRLDILSHGRTEIAEGRYFLMGDNRVESCDSRIWGTVPRDAIVGKAIQIERDGETIDLR